MALLAATVTAITRLWGEEDLIDWTNPRPSDSPSAIDEDVLEQAVNTGIAAFARRGYSMTEESEELRYYCILWVVPPGRRPSQISELAKDWERLYPPVIGASAIVGTAIEEGGTDDRRELGRDTLADLDDPGDARTLRHYPRGGV